MHLENRRGLIWCESEISLSVYTGNRKGSNIMAAGGMIALAVISIEGLAELSSFRMIHLILVGIWIW